MSDRIFICGEYDLINRKVGDLSMVMMRRTELTRNYNSGDVVAVNGKEYILWGRSLDGKEQMVSYQLMPKGA